MDKLVWSALEHEDKTRSNDWFWALGVIVVTSSIAAIIFGDYFFAALLVIGGILLGFFAIKKPEMISYELNSKGIKIRSQLYPYENIKSFWVQTANDGLEPTLFIKSERMFVPIISIPIHNDNTDDIRGIMLSKSVAEEEMKESRSLQIMESLGF